MRRRQTASRLRRPAFACAAVSTLAAIALIGGDARAGNDPVAACIASYERYENRLAAGDLLGAKKGLGACGAASCPGALQRECVASLAALEPRIPTVVLVARDAANRDLADVRVLLDGAPLRERLDGREIELNPGPHRFLFETAGAAAVEHAVVIRERDKGRAIEVAFEPDRARTGLERDRELDASPAPSRARTVPTTSWIFGGIGATSLATSGIFGAMALSSRADANACRPDCSSRQVEIVNQRFLAADVTLGLAIVSLAAAVVIYFVQGDESPPAESARK